MRTLVERALRGDGAEVPPYMLKATREVKQPGKKGGRFHRTKTGKVAYGDEPIGHAKTGALRPGDRVSHDDGWTGTVKGPSKVPTGPRVGDMPHPETYRGRVDVENEEGTVYATDPSRLAHSRGSYEVKCDDCKKTMRHTDSMQESAAGGRCATCKGVGVKRTEPGGGGEPTPEEKSHLRKVMRDGEREGRRAFRTQHGAARAQEQERRAARKKVADIDTSSPAYHAKQAEQHRQEAEAARARGDERGAKHHEGYAEHHSAQAKEEGPRDTLRHLGIPDEQHDAVMQHMQDRDIELSNVSAQEFQNEARASWHVVRARASQVGRIHRAAEKASAKARENQAREDASRKGTAYKKPAGAAQGDLFAKALRGWRRP